MKIAELLGFRGKKQGGDSGFQNGNAYSFVTAPYGTEFDGYSGTYESDRIFTILRQIRSGNLTNYSDLVLYSRRIVSVSGMIDRYIDWVGGYIADKEKPREPLFIDGKTYDDVSKAWLAFYYKQSFYSQSGLKITGSEFEKDVFANVAVTGQSVIAKHKDGMISFAMFDAKITDNVVEFMGQKYYSKDIITIISWRDKSYPQIHMPIIAKSLPFASDHAFIAKHVSSNNQTTSKPIGVKENTALGTMSATNRLNSSSNGGLKDADNNSQSGGAGIIARVMARLDFKSVIALLAGEKLVRFPAGADENLIKQQPHLEELIAQPLGVSRAKLISSFKDFNFASLQVGDTADNNKGAQLADWFYKNARVPMFMRFVADNFNSQHAKISASCPYWVAQYQPTANYGKDIKAMTEAKEAELLDDKETKQKMGV